jgi:curved DNA-binding protein
MDTSNYYAILGISYTAGFDEIKRAYHRQVRQYHPDLNLGVAAAEVAIKAINAAAEILCDPKKRAEYDRRLAHNLSSRLPTHDRRNGHDVEYKVTITVAEARSGTERMLQFHAPNGQPYQITVPISPGATTRTRICIPGAGGPGLNGGRRGDLYVVVNILGK